MRRKLLAIFFALMLTLALGTAVACGGGEESGDGSPKVTVEGLEVVYDGTAKRPTVTVEPVDAGDLFVVLYQNGNRVSEAVDAGTYEVKISLSNTDEPFADITKEMIIKPKALDFSGATASEKQYDGTAGYEGELLGVNGIVSGDRVSVSVKGTFADEQIGENKSLTVAEVLLTGADASNYSASVPSLKADVIKRQLTIGGISVEGKAADGTTTATWSGTPVLGNVLDGDDVSVEITNIAFPSAESGTYQMAVTADLSGADAANYEIAAESGIEGKIFSASGDFLFDESTGTVTGYTGESTDIVIPETIAGVAVKAIGDKAFTMSDNGHASVKITSISLPNALESIGEAAFTNTLIESINIPATVKSIGENAFYYCAALETVTFGDGIGEMTWGRGTFRNTAVKNITIPAGLATIPALCFQDTTGTGTFTIPATVTRLGDSAFLRSKYESFVFAPGTADLVCEKQVFAGASMRAFEIPARMVEMGGSFFQDAAKLTSLTFADRTKPLTAHKIEGAAAGFHLAGTAVTSLNIPGSVGAVPDGMANNVPLRSLTLGEGITSIEPYAFYGTALESVTFPKSLESIGASAFQGSSVLTEIIFEKGGSADLTIGAWSFQACGITSLEVPARTVSLGAACFAGNKIKTLTFETGGTKPLVFEDGEDPTSQGKGYHFDQCPLDPVVLPKRTVKFTLPNVFPADVSVTYEE